MTKTKLARRMNRIWTNDPNVTIHMTGFRAATVALDMPGTMTQTSLRISRVRADGSLGLQAVRVVTFAAEESMGALENFALLHGWTIDCEEGRLKVSPRDSKNVFATDSISEAFTHIAATVAG